jgi:NAD(P)H dehydrogenase (quinone)
MKVLYIYAHPEPKSFNGALKDAAMVTLARKGHQVKVTNLYALQFKAVLDSHDFRIRARNDLFNPASEQIHGLATHSLAPDILEEIEKIAWADLIIFQFPVWWSNMPAILKGWFDRVFVQGFVVDLKAGRLYDRGLLRGKTAMLAVTTGSSAEMYAPGGIHGDLLQHLSVIMHNTLEFTGLSVLPPFVVFGAADMSRERGAREIDRYRNILESL